MARESNRKTAARQVDFPLTPHPRGYWCKKVRGKLHYFGKIADDPNGQAAVEKWLAQKDYLLNGLTPPEDPTGLTIRELVNRFLDSKSLLLRTGELSERTFHQYDANCGRLVAFFGKRRLIADITPDDFG